MSDEQRRMNVALIPRTQDALDRTANRMGLSKTDVINRAIQAYDFLEEQLSSGAKIFVRRGNSTEEVRFL